MPPKISKTTLPARRSQRAAVRKSIIPTSGDPDRPDEAIPIDSLNFKIATPEEQSHRPSSSLHDEGISSVYNDVRATITEANRADSGPVGPEISSNCKSSMEPIVAPEGNDLLNNNVLEIPESSGLNRPELHNCSLEVEPGNTGNVGGSSGKRTVVRRVVRVVKKVVRKKIPKKIVKEGNLGIEEVEKNENLETIKSVSECTNVETASSCGVNVIETENLKLDGSVVAEEISNEDSRNSVMETMVVKENSFSGDDKVESKNMEELEVAVKENPPGPRKVKKVAKKTVPNRVAKRALTDEEGKNVEDAMYSDEKNENFEQILNVSESMVVDKGDSSNVGLKEMENSKCNDGLILELKNEDSRDTLVDGNAVSENRKELKVPENEKPMEHTRLEDNLGNENTSPPVMLPVSDKPIPLEVEGTEDGLGNKYVATSLELPKVVPVEGERTDRELEKKNVGLVEDVCMVPVGEPDSDEGVKGVKEPLENNSDMLNRGLVWSGEMEALERRKRRKKEIFVGGLDKDAKEEDIRKVFEEVGEIMEVRLVMNSKTGKNKGFAFVRYTSADDATKALTKYSKVEIRGKECGVTPVEGNDTLYLGNINKNWKTEDIIKLFKEAGIDKIDEVTVIADPKNIERNRGFAFVEFETCKDAQYAFNKLQVKDAFGSHQQIKVAWAQPLIEPDQDEILKVKSVYAEYLPSSWDEEEVKEYFKRFGEIESITLAKTLPLSRRKDFAFVNYFSREAALACIEAFSREQIDNDDSKAKMKVSLAKPLPKGKQTKHLSNATTKELPKEKRKAANPITHSREPKSIRKHTGNSHEAVTVERRSSTNAELVQLLRQQALGGQAPPGNAMAGYATLNHQSPSLGSKWPYSATVVKVNDPLPSDRRGFPQLTLGRSYPGQIQSSTPYGVNIASSSYYRHQGLSYASESLSRDGNYPSQSQTRQQAFYYDHNGVPRRY